MMMTCNSRLPWIPMGSWLMAMATLFCRMALALLSRFRRSFDMMRGAAIIAHRAIWERACSTLRPKFPMMSWREISEGFEAWWSIKEMGHMQLLKLRKSGRLLNVTAAHHPKGLNDAEKISNQDYFDLYCTCDMVCEIAIAPETCPHLIFCSFRDDLSWLYRCFLTRLCTATNYKTMWRTKFLFRYIWCWQCHFLSRPEVCQPVSCRLGFLVILKVFQHIQYIHSPKILVRTNGYTCLPL